MKWQVMFRQISVEGDIKEKVLKKLAPLSKYLGKVNKDSRQGKIKLSKGDRWGYRVQMLLNLAGRKMLVTGRGKELLSALDEAYERGVRRVRKYYEKQADKKIKRTKKL